MPKHHDKPFNWERAGAELALTLTFEGRWTREEIARKCSISVRTLYDWMKHPGFQARLETMRADFAASIRAVIYADKARRIMALDAMAESARREYEQRPWLQEVRPTPNGDITNESFNRDAHAAFRDALADIAAELGARKNVTELTGPDGGPVQAVFYVPEAELPPDELTHDSANQSDD